MTAATYLVGLLWGLARLPAGVSAAPGKSLTEATMNPRLRGMEYAVRGRVVLAANRIAAELAADDGHPHPFSRILYTNIGNPHSVGQRPLTWPRQVLALADLPAEVGVDHPRAGELFPPDAIDRAREVRAALGGHGTGAYTHSQGPRAFREDIANFIAERDGGVASDPDDIFMSNGASAAIQDVLTALIADDTCGVMIPIPQYPIYSATIDLLGGHQVGYHLDERAGWDLNVAELERALAAAKDRGIHVTSFVLINPGNPTGQVLSARAVRDIVTFCANHGLVLLADEVYQENVYAAGAEFVSCKKAAADAGLLESDAIELVSFHSTSKGLYGECGRRGGYMELAGIDGKVKEHLYKKASASLCSGVPGQIMTDLMVRGPCPGDASYESHEAEKQAIFDSLRRRARLVGEGLDAIPGFSCQPAQGAMYVFPRVEMPEGAMAAAKELGVPVDALYALSLLEQTGICVVPGSGFAQEEGRWGFRTTFLPPEAEMEEAVAQFREHHEEFCRRYA